MRVSVSVLMVFLVFFVNCKNNTRVLDWRYDRTGIYAEENNLLKIWPEEGPELVWSIDSGLGLGYASPVITDKFVYIPGMIDSIGHMKCYTLNGELVWDVMYGKSWNKKSFPGVRSTPVIKGNELFMLSGQGVAFKMDAETGKILWETDLIETFGAQIPVFGFCESPLLIDDNVIFTPGGKDVAVVALKQKDGSHVWSAKGRGDVSAYCSAVSFEHNGRKVVTTMTRDYLIGIDYLSGDTLWTIYSYKEWTDNSNSPVYKNGELFITSPYKVGARMFKLSHDATSVEEKWYNAAFDNQIGGTVEINGFIYGLSISKKQWMCVNRETGETQWSSRLLKPGSIIAADGMLYCYADDGVLALVEPNNLSFNIVSSFKVFEGKQQFTHPVIADGKLYMRYQEGIKVFNISNSGI